MLQSLTLKGMSALKAVVGGGRVGDYPLEDDEMSDGDRDQLHAVIEQSLDACEAGLSVFVEHTYQVVVAPKARALLAEASVWWIENGRAQSTFLREEADRVSSLLATSPQSGLPYQALRGRDVWRIRLKKTPYFLYYIVNELASPEAPRHGWT